LVDLFDEAKVEGAAADEVEIPRTEWRFDGSSAGWIAGPGVRSLAVREGKLVGRTTSATPVLYVKRTTGLQDFDLLHAVLEKRCSSSLGASRRSLPEKRC
jgi:hypothetical protein